MTTGACTQYVERLGHQSNVAGRVMINVTPSIGSAGTPLTIDGRGFTPGAEVTIQFMTARELRPGLTLGPFTADSAGNVLVSAPAPPSLYSCTAIDIHSDQDRPRDARQLDDPFVVWFAYGPADGCSDLRSIGAGFRDPDDPLVILDPPRGPPGTEVIVQASGLPASVPVAFVLGRPFSDRTGPDLEFTAVADEHGNLTDSVRIPEIAEWDGGSCIGVELVYRDEQGLLVFSDALYEVVPYP